jgi:hypothetical protein
MGPRTSTGVEFLGTKGTLSISRRGFAVTPDADVPPVNMIPGVREGHPVGGPKALPAPKRGPRTAGIDDQTGNSDEQYTEHARNFLECVRTRKTPVADLASAHRVAVACHLANLSMRLGRSLKWDWKTNAVPGDAEANAALARPYRAPWDRELKALGVG